jgi:hypothetical protein
MAKRSEIRVETYEVVVIRQYNSSTDRACATCKKETGTQPLANNSLSVSEPVALGTQATADRGPPVTAHRLKCFCPSMWISRIFKARCQK